MPLKLIAFSTSDGIECNGIQNLPSGRPVATVIHVHGKCGNFYQNTFIAFMAEAYERRMITFVAFNNRGHDCVVEAYRNGKVEYLGGSIETFEESAIDIEAAVGFAAAHADTPIILQGHSNGCEKVVHYIRQTGDPRVTAIILISPADSRRLHEAYVAPVPLDTIRQLSSARPLVQFAPANEYGIRHGQADYPIPITNGALHRLIDSPAYGLFAFEDARVAWSIPTPTLAYLGRQDALLTVPAREAANWLARRFNNLEVVSWSNGDHHFHGGEAEVCAELGDWVVRTLAPS